MNGGFWSRIGRCVWTNQSILKRTKSIKVKNSRQNERSSVNTVSQTFSGDFIGEKSRENERSFALYSFTNYFVRHFKLHQTTKKAARLQKMRVYIAGKLTTRVIGHSGEKTKQMGLKQRLVRTCFPESH